MDGIVCRVTDNSEKPRKAGGEGSLGTETGSRKEKGDQRKRTAGQVPSEKRMGRGGRQFVMVTMKERSSN